MRQRRKGRLIYFSIGRKKGVEIRPRSLILISSEREKRKGELPVPFIGKKGEKLEAIPFPGGVGGE